MLYFLQQFSDVFGALNVFRFLTFRTGGAVVTALFFIFMFGPGMISRLRVRQGQGQPIRDDGPVGHIIAKKGTPTMGGLMILSGAVLSTLLWADLSNAFVWVVLLVSVVLLRFDRKERRAARNGRQRRITPLLWAVSGAPLTPRFRLGAMRRNRNEAGALPSPTR